MIMQKTINRPWLRVLCVCMVLCMLVGMLPATVSAATPSKLYLMPNSNWTKDGARFAAYFFGNGYTWVSGVKLSNGMYEFNVPSGYPNVIFCRMNGSAAANDWNNKWNQTGDLKVPTDGNNLYTVPSGSWDGGTAQWGKFDPCGILGHQFTNHICNTCGIHECDAKGHNFENNVCSVCGAKECDVKGHQFENDICGICGHARYMNIYFRNDWFWSNVTVHFWGTDTDIGTAFPGAAMTLYDNDGTYDYYVLKVPTDIDGLLFVGNKNDAPNVQDQSPDVNSGWYDGIVYYMHWDGGNKVSSFDICDVKFPCKHPNQKPVSGHEATCTQTGLTDGIVCVDCGETIKAQDEIPAKGHNWNDATCTEAKTCSVCGATEGEPAGHGYMNGYEYIETSEGHEVRCADCSEYSYQEDHSYGENHYCICGAAELMTVTFMNGDEVWDVFERYYETWVAFVGMEYPTKEGYSFTGWYTAEGEKIHNKTVVTDNMVVYADFRINTYTVTWIVDGVATEETYEHGQTPVFIGSTDKAQDGCTVYTFDGWDREIVAVTDNVTYTAVYTETAIHSFTAAEYKWAEDYASCTAIGVCACGETASEIAFSAVCELKGASCVNPAYLEFRVGFDAPWAELQTVEAYDPAGVKDPTVHAYGTRYINNGENHVEICVACNVPVAEPEEHNKDIVLYGGNCQYVAVYRCSKCYYEYSGEKNPDVHAAGSTIKTNNGDGTHAELWPCCNQIVIAAQEHVDTNGQDGRCDECHGLVHPAYLRQVSVSLKGNIALNYYMLLSEEVLADETAYMQFTMADGEVIKLPVSQGVEQNSQGETYYVFTCAVSAKEMTDAVLSQFFYDGGSTREHTYSVQTYAKHILTNYDDAAIKDLITSMLNYGAASQLHFGYNTDKLANADLEAPDYSNVTIDGFKPVAGQGTELAKLYSASLILKSETTLRIFFKVDAAVENLTVTYQGQALEVKQRSGLSYVDVVGISAKALDEVVTVTVNDGANTAEVAFNPMSYSQGVLNDTTGAFGQDMKDLVAALYLYNKAANVYFKEV